MEKELSKSGVIYDPVIGQIEGALKEGYDLIYSGNLDNTHEVYIKIQELYLKLKSPNPDLYSKIINFYNKII